MQSKTNLGIGLLAVLASAFAPACSDDDKVHSVLDGGGSAEPDASSTTPDGGPSTATDGGGCTVTVTPSSDVGKSIDEVASGGTLCFGPGTYHLKEHLALTGAQNVTFKGTGAKRDDVLLDFTEQTQGDEGILVSTDGFTIENLSIKNTPGHGIKVQAANSIFRNIKVGWDHSTLTDAGPTSGGYAIYPTGCENTLMEDNEVYGASDAGIYAGQCKNVVARRNNSHGNVLGIEIENTISADVYDNDVHDNTCGVLLDLLPDLQQKTSKNYLVHDNHVYDNNLPNFAKRNTTAAVMPQGTGMLVLAATDVEITKNKIEGNDGVGIIVVSYEMIDLLTIANGGTPSTADPETNRWPERIFIHDNTFAGNGTDPVGAYTLLATGSDGGKQLVEQNVLWDGILSPKTKDDAAAKICLGETEQGTFLNFHGDTLLSNSPDLSTDTAAHQCTLPAVPPLTQ